MFNIEWKENAIRELNKLEPIIARRIFSKIEKLKINPYVEDIRRLKGENYFRFRVGDYRIIFEIYNDTIIILKVGHRKNIYK